MLLKGNVFMLKQLMEIIEPEKDYEYYSLPLELIKKIKDSQDYINWMKKESKGYIYYKPLFSSLNTDTKFYEKVKNTIRDQDDFYQRVTEFISNEPPLSMTFGNIVCFCKTNDTDEGSSLLMIEKKSKIKCEYKNFLKLMSNEDLKKIFILSTNTFMNRRSSSFAVQDSFEKRIESYVKKSLEEYLKNYTKDSKNFSINPMIYIDYNDGNTYWDNMSNLDKMKLYLNSNKDKLEIPDYLKYRYMDILKNLIKFIEEDKMDVSSYIKYLKKNATALVKANYVLSNKEISWIPKSELKVYAERFPEIAEKLNLQTDYTNVLVNEYLNMPYVSFIWDLEIFSNIKGPALKYMQKNRNFVINVFYKLVGIDKENVFKNSAGEGTEIYQIYNTNKMSLPYKRFINETSVSRNEIQITLLKLIEFCLSNENDLKNYVVNNDVSGMVDLYISKLEAKAMKEDVDNMEPLAKSKKVVRKF